MIPGFVYRLRKMVVIKISMKTYQRMEICGRGCKMTLERMLTERHVSYWAVVPQVRYNRFRLNIKNAFHHESKSGNYHHVTLCGGRGCNFRGLWKNLGCQFDTITWFMEWHILSPTVQSLVLYRHRSLTQTQVWFSRVSVLISLNTASVSHRIKSKTNYISSKIRSTTLVCGVM